MRLDRELIQLSCAAGLWAVLAAAGLSGCVQRPPAYGYAQPVAAPVQQPAASQHSHWEFVGCVHSTHECDELAHRDGYQEHTVRNDGRCSHQDLSCYAY